MAATACDVCGATTPQDARFCPECGARLDVDVVDLSSLADDRNLGSAPPSRPGSARLLAVAAAVLAAAFGGLWLLSTGEDNAEKAAEPPSATADRPPSTTDEGPDASSATTASGDGGDANSLESILSIDPMLVALDEVLEPRQRSSVGLVAADDALFWLTGVLSTSPWASAAGGHTELQVRRSDDGGATWAPLAHDLPSGTIVGAVGTESGRLVAAGTDADGTLTVWRSRDGVSWTADALVNADPGDTTIRTPTAVLETPEGLVVLSRRTPDVGVLHPLMPGHSNELTVQIERDGTDERLVFTGPFGIRSPGPSVADAAVTPRMRGVLDELSGRSSAGDRGSIWIQRADGWGETEVRSVPGDAVVLSDGTPLVVGDNAEWTLDDSGQWEARPLEPHVAAVTSWNGETVAAGAGDLHVRREDGSWEPMGLGAVLGSDQQHPFFIEAVGGPDVLALALIGPPAQQVELLPGILAKDGFLLTAVPDDATLVVAAPSGAEVTIALWEPTLPDDVTLDVGRGVLIVPDPIDGATVEFTLAELGALFRSTITTTGRGRGQILVSPDGVTWRRAVVGDDAFAAQLLPTPTGVLAVAGHWGPPGYGATTSSVRLVRVSSE